MGLWWAVLGSVMLYSTLTYKCSSIVREHKTAVRGHGGYFQIQPGTAPARAWYSLLEPISLVQPRTPYSSLFKMNPVPNSLVKPPNYPHSVGYSPTGLDFGVLICAGLLGSGGLFWALLCLLGPIRLYRAGPHYSL